MLCSVFKYTDIEKVDDSSNFSVVHKNHRKSHSLVLESSTARAALELWAFLDMRNPRGLITH